MTYLAVGEHVGAGLLAGLDDREAVGQHVRGEARCGVVVVEIAREEKGGRVRVYTHTHSARRLNAKPPTHPRTCEAHEGVAGHAGLDPRRLGQVRLAYVVDHEPGVWLMYVMK